MAMFYSEISPAKQRGRFVVMNHVGFVAGLALGFWYVPFFTLTSQVVSTVISPFPPGSDTPSPSGTAFVASTLVGDSL